MRKVEDQMQGLPPKQPLTKSGMTLRDYFAGQALIGILASTTEGDCAVIAEDSYSVADSMIKERNK